jgi:hypothetical protein
MGQCSRRISEERGRGWCEEFERGRRLFIAGDRCCGCGQVDHGGEATAAQRLGRGRGTVLGVLESETGLIAQKTVDRSVVVMVVYRGTAADIDDEDDGDRASGRESMSGG